MTLPVQGEEEEEVFKMTMKDRSRVAINKLIILTFQGVANTTIMNCVPFFICNNIMNLLVTFFPYTVEKERQ